MVVGAEAEAGAETAMAAGVGMERARLAMADGEEKVVVVVHKTSTRDSDTMCTASWPSRGYTSACNRCILRLPLQHHGQNGRRKALAVVGKVKAVVAAAAVLAAARGAVKVLVHKGGEGTDRVPMVRGEAGVVAHRKRCSPGSGTRSSERRPSPVHTNPCTRSMMCRQMCVDPHHTELLAHRRRRTKHGGGPERVGGSGRSPSSSELPVCAPSPEPAGVPLGSAERNLCLSHTQTPCARGVRAYSTYCLVPSVLTAHGWRRWRPSERLRRVAARTKPL